jgi:hypothetical protein
MNGVLAKARGEAQEYKNWIPPSGVGRRIEYRLARTEFPIVDDLFKIYSVSVQFGQNDVVQGVS